MKNDILSVWGGGVIFTVKLGPRPGFLDFRGGGGGGGGQSTRLH